MAGAVLELPCVLCACWREARAAGDERRQSPPLARSELDQPRRSRRFSRHGRRRGERAVVAFIQLSGMRPSSSMESCERARAGLSRLDSFQAAARAHRRQGITVSELVEVRPPRPWSTPPSPAARPPRRRRPAAPLMPPPSDPSLSCSSAAPPHLAVGVVRVQALGARPDETVTAHDLELARVPADLERLRASKSGRRERERERQHLGRTTANERGGPRDAPLLPSAGRA